MLLSHLTSGEEKRRGRSPFCRGRSSSASLFHYLSLHASPENPGRGGGGAKYTWRADVPQMKMYNRGSRHAKLAPTERRLKRVCFKSQPPPPSRVTLMVPPHGTLEMPGATGGEGASEEGARPPAKREEILTSPLRAPLPRRRGRARTAPVPTR